MQEALEADKACEVFIVLADESKQLDALGLASKLRSAGIAVTYLLAPTKVGKQFKQAEKSGAQLALIVGNEYPELAIKTLSLRTEETITASDDIADSILKRLNTTS